MTSTENALTIYIRSVRKTGSWSTQNHNPSRLSRMPGSSETARNNSLSIPISEKNWEEWYQYIEDLNDDLPDPEGLGDSWDNLPELAPELIEGSPSSRAQNANRWAVQKPENLSA